MSNGQNQKEGSRRLMEEEKMCQEALRKRTMSGRGEWSQCPHKISENWKN